MTVFLKLSTKIINVKYIQHIDIYNNQYIITLATNHNINGYNIGLFGFINSSSQERIVYYGDSELKNDKEDYLIVDKWIKSLKFTNQNNE